MTVTWTRRELDRDVEENAELYETLAHEAGGE
mgnify:CR=1 FL=1